MARIETVLALIRLKEDGEKYHIVFLLAADFYRVVLTAIDDNEVTSYINAVHIPVSSATKNPAGGESHRTAKFKTWGRRTGQHLY